MRENIQSAIHSMLDTWENKTTFIIIRTSPLSVVSWCPMTRTRSLRMRLDCSPPKRTECSLGKSEESRWRICGAEVQSRRSSSLGNALRVRICMLNESGCLCRQKEALWLTRQELTWSHLLSWSHQWQEGRESWESMIMVVLMTRQKTSCS